MIAPKGTRLWKDRQFVFNYLFHPDNLPVFCFLWPSGRKNTYYLAATGRYDVVLCPFSQGLIVETKSLLYEFCTLESATLQYYRILHVYRHLLFVRHHLSLTVTVQGCGD